MSDEAALRHRAILYVGGIPRAVPRLKAAVGSCQATLLHHDGGVEESLGRLETLVERCDLACCPVDCVSHDACRKTKQLCQRYGKPFVPLRSAGCAGLVPALTAALARDAADGPGKTPRRSKKKAKGGPGGSAAPRP